MDEYKVKQLRQMLAHETDSGEHFGAWLSHWYGGHPNAHHRRGRAESPYRVL